MMGIRSSYIFIVSKHNTESDSFHDVDDDNGNNMLNSWCGDAGMHGEIGRKKERIKELKYIFFICWSGNILCTVGAHSELISFSLWFE